jgi:hypothetical protein
MTSADIAFLVLVAYALAGLVAFIGFIVLVVMVIDHRERLRLVEARLASDRVSEGAREVFGDDPCDAPAQGQHASVGLWAGGGFDRPPMPTKYGDVGEYVERLAHHHIGPTGAPV